jgi:hypothetical protein
MEDVIDVARIEADDEYRFALRYRMITDLFWLTKYVLGYDKVTEHDHRVVADHFVKKDPTRSIDHQDTRRRRILLLPRKTFKTTFNIADSVQWILGFPDVAIMVMTASNSDDSPLADAFVTEVAEHFVCIEGQPKKPLHLCFPEHVITKRPKNGVFHDFISPARTKYRRDPTVTGVSIEQSLSGWHPDIIKSEDVQDNRNSQTAYALKKVRTNFYINLKMLGETGFLDITGTRYGPMDLYGDLMQKSDDNTIVLWKPAYIRKPHAMKVDDDLLTVDDVIMQFPQQLSWPFLRSEKILDESSFWTQYMNVAEGNFKPTFPIDRLNAAKVKDEHSEHEGKVHICWRFEYAECKNSAGAAGIEHEGRMTIVDIARGIYTPTALATRFVGMAKRWNCHSVEVEDTPGAESMVTHIRNEAIEQDWRIQITWSPYLQDETARQLKIKTAEPHLMAGRLLFADGISNVQEAFRQLYHFGMVEESEVANVISRVAGKLPASIASDELADLDEEQLTNYIERDAYDRVYGRGQYAAIEPAPDFEIYDFVPNRAPADLDDIMPGLSG